MSSSSNISASVRQAQDKKLSTKPASTMAELMAKHGKDVQPLRKGQKVTGRINKFTSAEVVIQINEKTEALVMEKDRKLHRQLMSLFAPGDTLEATVLYPESDEGYPVVTVRPFLEAKMWGNLENLQKSGQRLTATVSDSTKGGLLIETENGITGFLPNSHITGGKSTEELVGQKIQVHIEEIRRDAKKVVFSQKEVLTVEDFQSIAQKYKVGTKVNGKVSGITSFGIFVSLQYEKPGQGATVIDGLVHISEISWEKVENLSELFGIGDSVEAVVIGLDTRSKRIDLSIKKLTEDPFQKVMSAFPLEKKVKGIVTEVTTLGVILDLGEVEGVNVEGFIKKDKIPAATRYEVGQEIQSTVVALDNRKRKVMLTPILLEKPLMYR